ncbi:hypothetical protein [Paludibacterium denitrificans]|uniref:Uncharacterized protein n=1 Tax=Paludibacterium denitrificans TaxID=2675226 RepID=A0A844GB11_9NEIS|nr:hypothetical protein [Paludibacterium denitrificans]MTD33613.1 hypothetical protein [Paludibacterium denitrificans]
MTTQQKWLDQVQEVQSEEIQAPEAALKSAETPEQRKAAETQLPAAMLSATADQLK